MGANVRVLLVGLNPDIVDYSKSPVPGLTAAKVHAAVEGDKAKLETMGMGACFVGLRRPARRQL